MSEHPSPDLLARWREGQVTPADQAAIADHVRSCPECEEALEAPAVAIPGYRLLCRLGGGGDGDVYLAARLDDAEARVALKCLRPDRVADARARRALERDLLAPRHPNIVRILEVGPADGPPYYTMDPQPGSLKDRLQRGPLPIDEALALLRAVASAVAYLHGLSPAVVHLDLKPGNILLAADGRPLVADFGLARLLPDGRTQRMTHTAGTPAYMAPEQIRGHASPSCDVWALGVLLYEMLTGRPPFLGATPGEVIGQVLHQEVVPPRALNRQVAPALEAICLRCLDKNPRHRYATVADLLADLDAYLRDGVPPVPPSWREWIARELARHCRLEQPALWARVAGWTAFWSLFGHAVLWGLTGPRPPGWVYWAWLAVFQAFGWWPVLYWFGNAPRLAGVERGLLVNWLVIVVDALLFRLFCPVAGTPEPADVLRVYPAWLAMHGLLWFSAARQYWGRFYVLGLAFFATSAALPWLLPVAPLVFGGVNCAGMLWLSHGLRGIAREASEEPPTVPS